MGALALILRPRVLLALGVVSVIAALGAWNYVLGVRLDKAHAELALQRQNVATLEDAIRRQNAAVAGLGAESARRQAEVARRLERAPVARPNVIEAMKGSPRGNSTAERFEDIDRRFLESIR